MTFTTHVESFMETLPELKALFDTHWEELALDKDKVPLDPQYDEYAAREARGGVIFVSLRDKGQIVGYFIGFLGAGLHYRTCLTCHMDIFYTVPAIRGGRGGVVLFKAVEAELRRRGVNRFITSSKKHKDASRLFEALGFEQIETVYSKYLG